MVFGLPPETFLAVGIGILIPTILLLLWGLRFKEVTD